MTAIAVNTAIDSQALASAVIALQGAAGMNNMVTGTVDPVVGNDTTQGYGPRSIWINTTSSRWWICASAAAGAAVWYFGGTLIGTGTEPAGLLTQAGASTSGFTEEGNINRQLSLAGVGNGADTTDDTLFTFSLPANAFDVSGRGVCITASGKFAANGNNKTVKLKFGATTVVSTGVVTTNAGAWSLCVNVFKAGAAASNTQLATGGQFITGATHGGVVANTTPTETESGAITILCTGASGTSGAANDVLGQFFEVNFMN